MEIRWNLKELVGVDSYPLVLSLCTRIHQCVCYLVSRSTATLGKMCVCLWDMVSTMEQKKENGLTIETWRLPPSPSGDRLLLLCHHESKVSLHLQRCLITAAHGHPNSQGQPSAEMPHRQGCCNEIGKDQWLSL